MTPLSFEWHWNIEYLIFFGLLYLALAIIGIGIAYTYVKTWFDVDDEEAGVQTSTQMTARAKYTDY